MANMSHISNRRPCKTDFCNSLRRARSVPNTTSRPNTSINKGTLQRLSTPKSQDHRWMPDRPSVYWLDYIVDPTPHQLKDPEDLASYYENFEPRFPRTKFLSTPRKYYGTLYREDDENYSRPLTGAGIPLSALTYTASNRIRELSQPKTATGQDGTGIGTRSSERLLRSTRSKSPKGTHFDPSVDMARGDFQSRSKHGIHGIHTKHRSSSAGKFPRSVSNNSPANATTTRKPNKRNLYSLKT